MISFLINDESLVTSCLFPIKNNVSCTPKPYRHTFTIIPGQMIPLAEFVQWNLYTRTRSEEHQTMSVVAILQFKVHQLFKGLQSQIQFFLMNFF